MMNQVNAMTGAEKAARTRAGRRRAEEERLKRENIRVLAEDGFRASFEIGRGDTVESVVARLVENFGGPDACDEAYGYGGTDLTVWLGGRLVAVVRRGPDGRPVATVFE